MPGMVRSGGFISSTICRIASSTSSISRSSSEINRNEARRNVERQFAVAEIAIAESIVPDEESVARALQQIAQDNKMTIEQLQPHMDEAFQAAVAQSVITEKVLDFLVANSEIETIVKDV